MNTALPQQRKYRKDPYITMNLKTSHIRISPSASKHLNLAEGDRLHFLLDGQSDLWYLVKVNDGEDGHPVKEMKNSNKGAFLFSHRKTIRTIYDSVNYIGEYGRVMVGKQTELADWAGVTMWELNLNHLLNTDKNLSR